MSAYRYLRMLYFCIVLHDSYAIVFALNSNITRVASLQTSYLLIFCMYFNLENSLLILNLSCLVIIVWDNNLVLSLYPSHACWWPSYISFANCCHTWGNIILQQCLLKSFPFGCWLENKLIHTFLIDKKLCLCKSFTQFTGCPVAGYLFS